MSLQIFRSFPAVSFFLSFFLRKEGRYIVEIGVRRDERKEIRKVFLCCCEQTHTQEHVCEHMCACVSDCPSEDSSSCLHSYKLHTYLALIRVEKLRAGTLSPPLERCHLLRPQGCHSVTRTETHPSLPSAWQAETWRGGSLGIKRMNPILGANTPFPAIGWQFSAATLCHQDAWMP